MKSHCATLTRRTSAGTDILDITPEIESAVRDSGVEEGLCLVHVAGSTASISTIEFESGAVNDLRRALDRLAPTSGEYEHNLRWGDGNGYSHVRAALMGPSRVFPIHGGRLLLGTWQQIVLLDFDNRAREREILIQIVGA